MAQEAFRGGTTTILNVFTAEAAVATAEDSESRAHIAHVHALVGLYKALGGGWKDEASTPHTTALLGATTASIRPSE
jgi:outer membrane protein TolC